ncbi:MAG: thioesterase family protein [Cyanobacteriota bacterium]
MEHIFETKVYYFDTDSYGIVWHGAYVKWFEMGRVDFFNLLGENLDELKEQNVQFPVVNLSLRYKASARFGDVLLIKTTIEKLTKFSIAFKHQVYNKNDNKLLVIGTSEVVITNLEGKLLRKMPENLYCKFFDC